MSVPCPTALAVTLALLVRPGNPPPLTDPLPDITVGPTTVLLEDVGSGLQFCTDVAVPDDGSGRLFVTQREGVVALVEGDVLVPTPFLDLTAEYAGTPGAAMASLAFHPDFATNRRFYVIMTEIGDRNDADFGVTSGVVMQSVLYEYQAQAAWPAPGANSTDLSSRREILRINEGNVLHNLDDITFGPDGYLYLAKGDDDLGGQDLTTVHGSVLRIDTELLPGNAPGANGQYAIPADNPFVGTPGVVEEIWAYGFRNPWRLTTDAVTGKLYAADVGLDDIEEVNLLVSGGNYGWPFKEGTFALLPGGGVTDDLSGLPPGPFVDPVAQYDHGEGDKSISGGLIYRGSAFPTLVGRYVFADWISGGLLEADLQTGVIRRITVDPLGDQVDGQFNGGPEHGIIALRADGAGELVLVVTENALNNSGRIVRPKAGTWTDLEQGLAGAHGVPALTGTGTLLPTTPMTIGLTGGLESTLAYLVVGFSRLDFSPFYGGVLVPDIGPPGFFIPLFTNGAGDLLIAETWPPGVPAGFELYLQYWLEDAGGPFGKSASNALLATAP